jgi:hypothetical protein
MPIKTKYLVTCCRCGWTLKPWLEELLEGIPSKCHQCYSTQIDLTYTPAVEEEAP